MTSEQGWQQQGHPTWEAADQYFADAFVRPDAALQEALDAGNAASLPMRASVSASQGQFLRFLIEVTGAKTVLEVGTLGGYSTIWLAKSLPRGGRLVSIERARHRADVARHNIARAGLSDIVHIQVGEAGDEMAKMIAAGDDFDFIFVDADNVPRRVRDAIYLSHEGTVIVVDNVVRKGTVLDADITDIDAQSVRNMVTELAEIAAERNLLVSVLQTVTSKQYDGMLFIRVR